MDQWHGLTPRHGEENDNSQATVSNEEQLAGETVDIEVTSASTKASAVRVHDMDDVTDITAAAYKRFQDRERGKKGRRSAENHRVIRSRKNANWRKRTRNQAAQEKLNEYMHKRRCVTI